jgi:ABC-type multidrug transport system fused ATPase/permease subunit
MTESPLTKQLNTLIDNTVSKVTHISRHLTLVVYICLGLLVLSVIFSASMFVSIPFFLISCIPLFIIFKLTKTLLNVQKLDTGREEFIKLVDNQDTIKEKMKDSFANAKSSMGKGKESIGVMELIERAKVFLDVKKMMKERNLNSGSAIELSSAISSIALLGNPFYMMFIALCYLWLLLICLWSVSTIIF